MRGAARDAAPFLWTYWAANGTKSAGQGRYGLRVRYGYLTRDWVQPVPLLKDALHPLLRTQAAGA